MIPSTLTIDYERFLPLILMLLGGLLLYLSPTHWGALWNFPCSLVLILFCATWLGQQKKSPHSSVWVATCFFIPAIGYTVWKRQILLLDLDYVVAQQGAAHSLRLTQHAAEGVAPLVLVAAVCAFFIHRRISFLLFAIGIPTLASRYILQLAAMELDRDSVVEASQKIILTEAFRVIPLLIGFLLGHLSQRLERKLIIAITIIGVWLTTPLISLYLWLLPTALPHENSPTSHEQMGVAAVGANPNDARFHEQLNAQGSELIPGLEWWCNTKVRPSWRTNSRATATLSLAKDDTLEDLRPHLPEILYRGVTRLAFIGTAKEQHSLPPLRKHLQYPAARWLLDPPPPDAHQGRIQDNELFWNGELPPKPQACAIWADWNTNIDTLFRIGTALDEPSGPCAYRLFLVFGEKNGSWNAPLPCSNPQ